MTDKSKYLDVFVEEAKENLQVINNVLLELEEKGFREESMNEAFRVVHTIKGTAGVIGIESIRDLTHVMEDLFDLLRKKRQAPDKQLLGLLFQSVDLIEKMIDELERTGTTTLPIADTVAQIKHYMDAPIEEASVTIDAPPLELTLEQRGQVDKALSDGNQVFDLLVSFQPDLQFKQGRAYQLLRKLSTQGTVISSSPTWSAVEDTDRTIKLVYVTAETADRVRGAAMDVTGVVDATVVPFNTACLPQAPAETKDAADVSSRGEKSLTTGSTIRVKSSLLDQLLNIVGEIMINNIRIDQISADLRNRELKQILQDNSRLMSQLQDTVLRTRMVPVDFIFKRFPRMVRDMSNDVGKEVDFTMKGNDIEIDRSLLDEIGDALVHLLRNAVDHGIEAPDKRKSAGKSSRGSVTLSAFQEQSNIVITVEDDGRGMDPAKIAAKAVEKGLITAEDAARLPDKNKLAFIFLPGFSTAEKVTDISGRGVGMDVVKTKIEGLGGFVRLDTEIGKGTKITLKLPPSMSIIRVMLVEINKEKYAIPLENVLETVRVPMDEVHQTANAGMFRLREEVLPVLNIHNEFGGISQSTSKDMPALIVEKNENRACLMVTRLIGQQEIVVKGLGKDLRSAGYFSGATILGDGKVAMILDVGAFM